MRQVATFPRSAVFAAFGPIVLVVCLSASLDAASQEPPPAPPESLARIREGLKQPPPRRFKLDMPVPVATFKTSVEQRVYVLTLENWIEKEFKLTALQRQSAEWGSKCCGLSLDPLFKSAGRALQRRKERKIREQIARELAQLEARRKQ
jgi:hypothetical protein